MKPFQMYAPEAIDVVTQEQAGLAERFCAHIASVRADMHVSVETWVRVSPGLDIAEVIRAACDARHRRLGLEAIEPQADGSWCVGGDAVCLEVLESQGERTRVRLSQPVFSFCSPLDSATWQA